MVTVATQHNILDEIISHKRVEVAQRKELYSVSMLEKSNHFETEINSLKSSITRISSSGIIAEFKRRSPSKGDINEQVDVEQVSTGYVQAGAAALSILTDKHFFGGSNEDLTIASTFNDCPILRKDFIIDEYQIIEARSIGADAILLIAAVLNPEEAKSLASFAKSVELEVLLEVRSKEEIQDFANEYIDVVGVNNRNLKTFEVDVNKSLELVNEIPNDFAKISESGISNPAVAYQLQSAGFNGLLMGERFMKSSRPHITCAEFIKELKDIN